ncbi:MAG: hypothetical protein OXH47_03955 [Paracoccaceae bacterium]|nr:hypothetical protein [Paracoccaceae bacterium]
MTTRASCSTVIGFETGASAFVAFETKTRSIRLPPKASADAGFQHLGTYVHKSQSVASPPAGTAACHLGVPPGDRTAPEAEQQGEGRHRLHP